MGLALAALLEEALRPVEIAGGDCPIEVLIDALRCRLLRGLGEVGRILALRGGLLVQLERPEELLLEEKQVPGLDGAFGAHLAIIRRRWLRELQEQGGGECAR